MTRSKTSLCLVHEENIIKPDINLPSRTLPSPLVVLFPGVASTSSYNSQPTAPPTDKTSVGCRTYNRFAATVTRGLQSTHINFTSRSASWRLQETHTYCVCVRVCGSFSKVSVAASIFKRALSCRSENRSSWQVMHERGGQEER